MKALLFLCTILLNISLLAQTAAPQDSPAPAQATEDYSGTYSFLQEGEFVQINVEGQGKITGFVSRFGDTETDRGLFLDHFFKEGKLDGKNLTFSTKTVHSVWYDFKGTVERGDGKKVGDEGYYVLKGTLIQFILDAQQKTTSKSRDVAFKAFPQDLGDTSPKK